MYQWLKNNIETVRKSILESAFRAGRSPEDILLVAVSKTVQPDIIKAAFEEGLTHFGENKVQELTDKVVKLPEAKWHLIGHLQKNKVKYIVDKVAMIHSLDSLALAEEISKRAQKAGKTVDVLIQVNAAREETKFGIDPLETEDFITAVKDIPGILVKGLMTIAPYVTSPEEVRPVFKEMKSQFARLKIMDIPKVEMKYLSMGMSNDYKVAIEEGANLIRIGSSIFGARNY